MDVRLIPTDVRHIFVEWSGYAKTVGPTGGRVVDTSQVGNGACVLERLVNGRDVSVSELAQIVGDGFFVHMTSPFIAHVYFSLELDASHGIAPVGPVHLALKQGDGEGSV